MRHFVRHSRREFVDGNIYVDIRFRVKRKIDSRDSEITHRNGKNDLFRANFIPRKIIGIKSIKFFVQNFGQFDKSVRRDNIPVFIAFEFGGGGVKSLDIIFRGRI